MVKSPWKLLTGLLSREKTADQHAGQASVAGIPNEAEGHGANSTATESPFGGEPAPGSTQSAASQAAKAEARDRHEPPLVMATEVTGSMPPNEAPALARDRTVLAIVAERRNHKGRAPPSTRRKVKAEAPGYTRDVVPAADLAEQRASTPDPVRALDSEIRELRYLLAGKLRLQNDQLRQMLRRFEPK